MTSTITNAGIIANTASAVVIKDEADNDVTSNYDISYVNGILKVIKAIIHKRSRSGSSIWLERRPVTAEVASSSLVRIAI